VRLRAATGPLDATVEVPGSKSIANRALVCAALADGESELVGIPLGDDTRAMTECLTRLGVAVSAANDRALVTGTGGRLAAGAVRLDTGLAGTTSRFVTAMATLAPGPVTVDGGAPTSEGGGGAPRAVALRSHGGNRRSDAVRRLAERMLTVVRTLHLRQRGVIDYLVDAISAHRQGLATPKLLPEG